MGYIDTTPGADLPIFYNVVHAVGKNCPNLRDDVKLVQYLLMAFYEKAQFMGLSKPSGDIAVTGFCGAATLNWILQFQLDANEGAAEGDRVLVDNRVDRIRDKVHFIGSISHTSYTLGALNLSVQAYNPEAFAATPLLIPLENPLNVPPPSND